MNYFIGEEMFNFLWNIYFKVIKLFVFVKCFFYVYCSFERERGGGGLIDFFFSDMLFFLRC